MFWLFTHQDSSSTSLVTPPALEGLGSDSFWLVFGLTNSFAPLLCTVFIQGDSVPIEGFAALLVDVYLVLQQDGVTLIQAADVKNGNEVVQLVDASKGHGLPHRALTAPCLPLHNRHRSWFVEILYCQ